MSQSELDKAKHEISIYAKELQEAIRKHSEFSEEVQKKVREDPDNAMAITLANYPKKETLRQQIEELMTKVISAQRAYIQLLEKLSGKK